MGAVNQTMGVPSHFLPVPLLPLEVDPLNPANWSGEKGWKLPSPAARSIEFGAFQR